MQNFDGEKPGGFYFSLPRLIARNLGRDYGQSENSWTEANVVGAAVHFISFLFLARLLIVSQDLGGRLGLFVCLVPALLIFWMVVLYLISLLIKFLRQLGFFCNSSNSRAQTVIVMIMTSGFAVQLILHGGWMGLIGKVWLAAVAANLVAAIALRFSPAHAKQ